MKIIKLNFINTEKNITLFKALNKNLGLNFVDIKSLIRKKDIKVNGIRKTEDCILNINDEVVCFVPFKIEIVYEDENVLIVNKPKHIETISQTSNNSLTSQLQQIYPSCTPCNRLDTNTTGINIFALNKESEKEILDAFKQKRAIKKYYAVVSGNVKDEKILRDFLVKNCNTKTVKICKNKGENAVSVITEYKKIKQINNDLFLIEVGKTHQIRAHLNAYGIYILGDEKYGNREINKKYNKYTQFLISYSIAFDFSEHSRLQYMSGKTFCLSYDINDIKF